MKKAVLILLTGWLVFSCGTVPQYHPLKPRFSEPQRNKLWYVSRGYIGVQYKRGGVTKRGFDCSGYVYRVFLDALHFKLPRTVKGLYKSSFGIPVSAARTGDLVFFNIGSARPNHVGIMLGNRRFIHASRSKGVIISRLDETYYRRYFAGVRRLK